MNSEKLEKLELLVKSIENITKKQSLKIKFTFWFSSVIAVVAVSVVAYKLYCSYSVVSLELNDIKEEFSNLNSEYERINNDTIKSNLTGGHYNKQNCFIRPNTLR